MKINIGRKKKDYLINLYNSLSENLNNDKDFIAITNVIEKMYSVDIDIAIKWSFRQLNIYAIKGLYGKKDNMGVYTMVDTIIINLCRYYSIDKVIMLVYEFITIYEIRYIIYSYIFSVDNNKSKLFNYINESRDYNELYNTLKLLFINDGYVSKDIINLLEEIILRYINKIPNQNLLNMLYSLIKFIPSNKDRSILESYFVFYI